jgi:hypothetical protein
MVEARSRRKTGTDFSGSRSKAWSLAGAPAPKKEARPKGPGKPQLVAVQYSQKSLKNNGFFNDWASAGSGI